MSEYHSSQPAKSWKIGEVSITRIVEHESLFDMPMMFPKATMEALARLPWLWPEFLTPEAQGILSVHALVVEAPGCRILVDTCIGNDKNRAPFENATRMQTSFLEDLKAAGFPPESFDFVICTHMHFDHVGWNTMLKDGEWVPTFPNARYLIAQREYDQWRIDSQKPPASDFDQVQVLAFADSMKPVLDAGLVDLVEEGHVICDAVRLVPTPGHSAGHVSVLIESGGESAVITGDMTHHPCQLAHPDWGMPLDFDDAQAIDARRRIFSQAADENVLVIGTHWAGRTASYIRREGQAFCMKD